MPDTLLNETFKSVIQDERVRAVIERLEGERRRPRAGSPKDDGQNQDPYDYADRRVLDSSRPRRPRLSFVPRNARYARGRVRDFGRNVDPLFRGSYARQRGRSRDRRGTRPGESRDREAQSQRGWSRRLCGNSRGRCSADAARAGRFAGFCLDRRLAAPGRAFAGARLRSSLHNFALAGM